VAYCSQQDLERSLGGSQVLVELLDRTGAGIDATEVIDILDLASAEIASYIQVELDLSGITSPYPRLLVLKTADIAAYHAWSRGISRQAVPPPLQDLYAAAIQWAKDVGDKKATLGVAPKPAIDKRVGVVDFDPLSTSANANAGQGVRAGMSVAAMKMGFR